MTNPALDANSTTISVLLSYLRPFGLHEVRHGLQLALVVATIGIAWGLTIRRVDDTLFWAAMGAMAAFLCALGQPVTHRWFLFGWPIVGVVTAIVGVAFEII